MAYNFSDSPSNGDTFTLNGVTYTYNSTKGVWKDTAVGTPPAPSVTSSDTAPVSPSAGDLWYRTNDSTLYVYYNDGSSSQWVGVSGPSGPAGNNGAAGAAGADGADAITRYANLAAFPSSPTAADLAYANDTNTLYLYNGTAWEVVASGNDESPVITTEPPTVEQALNSDGTTSTVTMVAQDPEGFDIVYGIAYKTANNARPTQLSSDTTINQSTGVYTFTPTTTEANAGTFRARLSASDGARITTRFVDFNLTFIIADITNWQHHSLAPMEKITDGKTLTVNGGSWQSYVSNLSTLAPYLEGAWGTTDINSGMADAGSVTFDGPVRIWVLRDNTWNGVSDINTYTSHATLSSTAITGTNAVNVYRKDVSAGTYNLDTYSAMFFITAQDGSKDKLQYYGTDLP
jgi:hypothetical protein